MSDMSHLYKAYAAVHDTDVNQQLNESRDEISAMDLTQLTKEDLVLVAEDIVEALFLEGVSAPDAFEAVASVLEESVSPDSSPLRKQKVTRLAEAFDSAFNKVTERAPEEAEIRFIEYRESKPLIEKWQGKVSHEHGNSKIHEACVAQDKKNVLEGFAKMLEGTMDIKGFEIPKKERDAAKERLKQKTLNIRGNNSAEQKARLEKKRGMKLDDHPQFKEENILGVPSKIRTEWAEAYTSIYEKKLAAPDHDPVGQEDKDIDNDGDHDKTDKYLLNRRKVIGKAIAKGKGVKEEVTFSAEEQARIDAIVKSWDAE
jgi:hypothetical protein